MCKLFLLLGWIFISNNLSAQWQNDVRLTNAPGDSYNSYNNGKCLAASGNDLYIVWADLRDGNGEIYFKHSPDKGATWDADVRLTNDTSLSEFPSIAVTGSVVHVVWHDHRDGNAEIYYLRSANKGGTWDTSIRLTNSAGDSGFPSVITSGSIVHVVWRDDRDGQNEIYYKRSLDGGSNWDADIRLTNDPANSFSASVAVDDTVVHVVWEDYRDGNWEIYYKRSTNNGTTWGADTRLTNNSSFSEYPCVSVSGAVVHVAWNDNRDGNYEMYYKRSTDGGTSWGTDTRLTNNVYNSYRPSLATSGSLVHLVWHDVRDSNWEIYYKFSQDGGLNWTADTRLTNNIADSERPCIALSGTVAHVIWEDNRDGNYEMYYKRDTTSNIAGMEDKEVKNIPVTLYPNPASTTLRLSSDHFFTGKIQLTISNTVGQELFTGEIRPEENVNVSGLKNGIYFVHGIAEEKKIFNSVLMIAR